MKYLPLMLLAVSGLGCVSPLQASNGSVRFSGRVAEPPCSARTAAIPAEIVLERCPSAAEGAQLSVRALQASDDSVILAGAGGNTVARLDTSADRPRWFTRHYRLMDAQGTAPRAGAYLVRVDYP